MSLRRPARVTIPLPGEVEVHRRTFLKTGLVGAVLLAAGGSAWLATRRTAPATDVGGPLRVFSASEAAVLLAVADRLVPVRAGFPRPHQLQLAARVDGIVAMAHHATQQELRQLVRLFESAVAGLLLDAQPRLFTACSAEAQDRRLHAWAESRLALRRTGYRALKGLVYAAYYGSPETWSAVGYPGPPFRTGAAAAAGARAP